MTLRVCRECDKEVSTEAKVCPHCGISRPGTKFWERHLLLISVCILIALIWIANLSSRNSSVKTDVACDKKETARVLRLAREGGLLRKIDAQRSVPRVYLGPGWYVLELDKKKAAAYVFICEAYGGRFPADPLVVFHDSRSGEQLAEWGGLGFRVFK